MRWDSRRFFNNIHHIYAEDHEGDERAGGKRRAVEFGAEKSEIHSPKSGGSEVKRVAGGGPIAECCFRAGGACWHSAGEASQQIQLSIAPFNASKEAPRNPNLNVRVILFSGGGVFKHRVMILSSSPNEVRRPAHNIWSQSTAAQALWRP